MNATGKNRLLELADFLDKLPDERDFALAHFAVEIKDGQPICGTSACAAGWAATIPEFRDAGYRLVRSSRDGWVSPAFDGEQGFEALERFFDLTSEEVQEAFDNYDEDANERRPDDPKDTARRLRSIANRAA